MKKSKDTTITAQIVMPASLYRQLQKEAANVGMSFSSYIKSIIARRQS